MNRILIGVVVLFCTACASAEPPTVAPVRELPMITIDGGRFVADGKEFKIWGFNQGRGLNLSDYHLRKSVDQLEFLGANVLRLHAIDWTFWGESDAKGNAVSSGLRPCGTDRTNTRELVNVDKFHRLMDALREKGIYVAITLTVCQNFVPGDVSVLETTEPDAQAWSQAVAELNAMDDGSQIHVFKVLPVFDERSLALRKEWAANLLNLRNPTTGLTLAQDPQLALLNVVNEGSSWSTFFRNNYMAHMPEYFLDKVKARWNGYLKDKYNGDEPLAAAWAQEGKKGLLDGESLGSGTVRLLPLDPVSLPKEEVEEKGFPGFSDARRTDYIRFLWEMDAEHQRTMREHFAAHGWTRPSSYCDTVGIDGTTGQWWMDSDLMPYVEDHPYDEANIDIFHWGWIRLYKYPGATFLVPRGGADRPHWASEIREGSGWLSWTRIPFPLFIAAYYSLQGRDGATWHVWSMDREHYLNETTMADDLSWCHCNWDTPWLYVYRAAGRLFRSCEIKPLPAGHEALARFADWDCQDANFQNERVVRIHGENRAILTVSTDHFRAVTSPYPQKKEFSDLAVDITSRTINTVIVEKISDRLYEVTAVGKAGDMKQGENIMFKPMTSVAGTVTFKNGTIASIEHVDHTGVVYETVEGDGSAMRFVPGVRLYRVHLR